MNDVVIIDNIVHRFIEILVQVARKQQHRIESKLLHGEPHIAVFCLQELVVPLLSSCPINDRDSLHLYGNCRA